MNVILFGTPDFALPIADMLLDLPDADLTAVVTVPDAPAGRGKRLTPPALKNWAEEHNVPVMQPLKLDAAFISSLAELEPTVGVIASYGKIIPKTVLDAFPHGVINVHPSLLPRHRGASPVQSTILMGDGASGVTLMLTDKEMDHGPLIAQESFPVWPKETAKELTMRLAQHAAQLLSETLPRWVGGKLEVREQDHAQATFAPVLKRDDGRIDWNDPAQAIERKVRGYDPWPGAFTTLPSGKRLKVLYIKIIEGDAAEPGTVAQAEDGSPMVRVQDAWIKLVRVQPEGKQPMDGPAFLNGHRDLIGQVLT